MTTPADDQAAVEATGDYPASSIIGSLAQRRAQIEDDLYLDLPVPHWSDPEIFVRYRPVPAPEIDKIQKASRTKAGKPRPIVEQLGTNKDVLVRHCVAVYARLEGREYTKDRPGESLRPGDPSGEYTRFDPDLAANLGLEEGASARDVVGGSGTAGLFYNDGDIFSHGAKLTEWSGFVMAEADDEFLGE